jgi:hypothetical protein
LCLRQQRRGAGCMSQRQQRQGRRHSERCARRYASRAAKIRPSRTAGRPLHIPIRTPWRVKALKCGPHPDSNPRKMRPHQGSGLSNQICAMKMN